MAMDVPPAPVGKDEQSIISYIKAFRQRVIAKLEWQVVQSGFLDNIPTNTTTADQNDFDMADDTQQDSSHDKDEDTVLYSSSEIWIWKNKRHVLDAVQTNISFIQKVLLDALETENAYTSHEQKSKKTELFKQVDKAFKFFNVEEWNRKQEKPLFKFPKSNHSFWGYIGAFYGLALKKGPTTDKYNACFDPRYVSDRLSPNFTGHNGIEPGQWFPSQLCAAWNGAHGESIVGMHYADGTLKSVIISKKVNDEQQGGNVVWYSGPDVTHIHQLEKIASATQRSHDETLVVRVLRAEDSGDNAPVKGYRYDGLYYVGEVEERDVGDDKPGRRIWFRLERVGEDGDGWPSDEQCSLTECKLRAGSEQQQLALFDKYKEGF
ncbi:Putative PUA-like superfamily, SRA-YDG superfamily protein [Septoria linicola]|uniref:PUA-like superfamily, SRA-YDG superfamily protein n=1 Tax=Septoria linicola TaxID=215465 RepID=A0A9Q9ELH1_9PEZI|nr:Putative PUA-like superfamily, SRA-YDG superfamily protein [Septoria linicola]